VHISTVARRAQVPTAGTSALRHPANFLVGVDKMPRKNSTYGNRALPEAGFSMASRREFLKTAVAVSAIPIVAGATIGPAEAAARSRALPLCKVIFDEQFPESRAFADRARELYLPVHGIRADITALWFNDLHARWQAGPAAIAGLTAPSALFCLERLAWDHGMRVVFHAEHRYLSRDIVQHAVFNGDEVLQPNDLDADAAHWPDRVAELVARYPSERRRSAGATAVGLARTADGNSMTLVSWIIAPIKKI